MGYCVTAQKGQQGQLSPHSGGLPVVATAVVAKKERVKVSTMISLRIMFIAFLCYEI
jgi:hypothetical protein